MTTTTIASPRPTFSLWRPASTPPPPRCNSGSRAYSVSGRNSESPAVGTIRTFSLGPASQALSISSSPTARILTKRGGSTSSAKARRQRDEAANPGDTIPAGSPAPTSNACFQEGISQGEDARQTVPMVTFGGADRRQGGEGCAIRSAPAVARRLDTACSARAGARGHRLSRKHGPAGKGRDPLVGPLAFPATVLRRLGGLRSVSDLPRPFRLRTRAKAHFPAI